MLTGATFDDILTLPSRSRDARIAYGADAHQFGDLRLPPHQSGRVPVVGFIHGGCWESHYDLTHADALVTAITDLGVASWSLEYRRLGHAGGGWPGTLLDVAAGIDFVRRLAMSHPIDPSRVIVMGHSAGGHLALWSAARPRLTNGRELFAADSLPVRGVVALAGISDLRAAYEQRVCESSVGRLMGGAPESVAERYAQGSPSALLPIGVPQILVHGSQDAIVPVTFSTTYAEAARTRGDSARAIVVEGAGHFDVISPESAAWPSIRDAIHELLRFSDS